MKYIEQIRPVETKDIVNNIGTSKHEYDLTFDPSSQNLREFKLLSKEELKNILFKLPNKMT